MLYSSKYYLCFAGLFETKFTMGVSHSNRQDRSCPLDGEGKINYYYYLVLRLSKLILHVGSQIIIHLLIIMHKIIHTSM